MSASQIYVLLVENTDKTKICASANFKDGGNLEDMAGDAQTINNGTRPLTVAGNVTQGNLKFGPWMVVTKKGKSRTEKGKEILRDVTCGHQESFGKESRFRILATMN